MRGSFEAILAAAAVICLAGAGAQAQSNFMPAKFPLSPAKALFLERERGRLPLVEAEVEGKRCVLIFDTGATHTTFDTSFIRENFPEKKLEKVMLGGETNVEAMPSLCHIGELVMGEARFEDFDAMTLDLRAIGASVGAKIDGVLGMNIIGSGRTLFSLAKGEIVFGAAKSARDGFESARRLALYDPLTLTLGVRAIGAESGGAARSVIIDSASSFTFLDESFGWPVCGQSHEIAARDVNGRGVLDSVQGAPGLLQFIDGCQIELTPLISKEPLNRIGADTLRSYDILVEPRAIGWRKAKPEEGKAK